MNARYYNHYCTEKEVRITYCECLCSFSYPACNTHAPYCNLWPTPIYKVFPHFLINGTIFEGGGSY